MIKVVRFFPTYMLNFALADKCKALFPMYNPDTDFWKFFASNMASGSLAAATTLLFVYPLDLVYTRMALDVGKGATREFSGLRSCFSAVFKTGLGSFYHGYEVSIAGAIVYRAAYFGIYDTMRQLCFGDSDTCNYFDLWLLAQGVTTAAMLLTYPFYTISANLMMQAGRSDTLYTGTLDCIRKMYAGGGVRAFYGGGLLRFASTVGGAFMMVVYDVIRNTYFS
ncbi:ADP/ATP carrier protein [Coemansia sp. RSA 552]|nr:ADP/ATP carrier protein [Coemansia sp. RSA 552]